ncbi:MAG: DUF2335 domain-containing protein [Candidatus Taylorbacteria bacterium]|nr:DUF2335 domain-containing protein [Candidatus Taylorbacteria bacterium]
MMQNRNQQLNNSNSGKMVGFERTEVFSGPVPTPEVIERYEKIYPGAAKIIFDKWDLQVKHRQHIEKSVVWTDNTKSILGVVFGFIIDLSTVGGGLYLLINQAIIWGFVVLLCGFGMLIFSVLISRRKNNNNIPDGTSQKSS